MKVWITKYALTRGIFQREVEDCGDGMIADRSSGYTAHYHANEWHAASAAAVKRAEEMRDAKMIALQRQIAKLKALRFDK